MPKAAKCANTTFGTAKKFPDDLEAAAMPGPGTYSSESKNTSFGKMFTIPKVLVVTNSSLLYLFHILLILINNFSIGYQTEVQSRKHAWSTGLPVR